MAGTTAVCLLPLWTARFPALQDYPQRLLHAHMVATRHDAGVDYDRDFEIRLVPGPYVAFFGLTAAASRVLPTETAGKLALCVYFLLVALAVVRLDAETPGDDPPWGALLLFPLAHHPQYYLGAINYCYALPLLLLALLEQARLLRGVAAPRALAWWAVWLIALFLCHPFGMLLFVVLGGLQSIVAWRRREQLARGLATTAVGAALFLGWFLTAGNPAGGAPLWIGGVRSVVEYAACSFTGMKALRGIEWPPVLLWLGVVALGVAGWRAGDGERRRLRRWATVPLVASVVGALVLPFSKGEFTYVNFRMVPVAWLFLGGVAATLTLRGRPWKILWVGLILALTMLSVAKQRRISAEVHEIMPLVEAIPPGARILPLVFDNDSPELDARFFDPHLHDHAYVHLLRGGGYNPYFWRSEMMPVHLRPEVQAAAPGPGEYDPWAFRWEQHAADFQFFLVRGQPAGFGAYLDPYAELVVESGPWLLYRRRPDAP